MSFRIHGMNFYRLHMHFRIFYMYFHMRDMHIFIVEMSDIEFVR
jgi:hypothetical protein